VRDDGLQLLVPVTYKLKHPSIGQQIGSANGRHPSPGGHGLVQVTVAGDWFGSAPQYSCQSSHRPSLLSDPQLPQLLQSHRGTQAPSG
jgi:hypothetical protein